jgi:hypothetical protein
LGAPPRYAASCDPVIHFPASLQEWLGEWTSARAEVTADFSLVPSHEQASELGTARNG